MATAVSEIAPRRSPVRARLAPQYERPAQRAFFVGCARWGAGARRTEDRVRAAYAPEIYERLVWLKDEFDPKTCSGSTRTSRLASRARASLYALPFFVLYALPFCVRAAEGDA